MSVEITSAQHRARQHVITAYFPSIVFLFKPNTPCPMFAHKRRLVWTAETLNQETLMRMVSKLNRTDELQGLGH